MLPRNFVQENCFVKPIATELKSLGKAIKNFQSLVTLFINLHRYLALETL